MEIKIKFRLVQDGKIIGVEEVIKQQWQWMSYALNPEHKEIWNPGVFPISDKPLVRQQFTGIKDINGKEIYEGDIAQVNNENCHVNLDPYWTCGWELKAKFGSYPFKGVVKNFIGADFRCKDIEIIGNIFENPELVSIKTESCQEK